MNRWTRVGMLLSGPVLSTGILALLVLKTRTDVEDVGSRLETGAAEPEMVPAGKRELANPESSSDEARKEYLRERETPPHIEAQLTTTAEAAWPLRVSAVKRLGEIGTEESRATLVRLLEREKNASVRSEVFLALAQCPAGFRDAKAHAALVGELRASRAPRVINTILHVLSVHGTADDLEILNEIKQRPLDAQVERNVLLAEKHIQERSEDGT